MAAWVARGVGLPSLLVFLGLGMALVGAGLGVRFDDAGRAQALELPTLVLILAEGGLTTHWAHAPAAAPAARASRARLATVGVAISGLAVAVAAHWLPALTWRDALLLGAVLSVRRKLPLPPRLSGCRKDGRAQRRACRTR